MPWREALFLVLEQLVDLGLVHVLDVLQVEPQLLGLLRFLSVHLQYGVVSLLQVLRRGARTSAAQVRYQECGYTRERFERKKKNLRATSPGQI